MVKASILDQTAADTVGQDAINEAAGNAHWMAYSAALNAGKSAREAMQEAEAARQAVINGKELSK